MGGRSGGAMDGKGVRTPWGDAADLRSMKMRPGRGNAPEESDRSQRERLFGAMVALSAEQGYEATKIADLVRLAGVSRAAFYEHFKDKQECLLAAVDALVEPTIALIERAEDAPSGEARVRQAVEAFLGLVVAPAGGLESGLRRGLRRRARGRGGGRAHARHLRALRGQPAQRDRRAQGHAAADGAGDARRLPEGDPEAPLLRRSRPAAAARRGHRRPGVSPTRRRPGRSRDRSGAGASRSPSPSARPSPILRSGCCGRLRRSSPRRATRRQRWPRWSSAPGPRSGSSTGTSRTRKTPSWRRSTRARRRCWPRVLPAFRRAKSWQESVRAAYEAMFSFGIEEPEYTQLGAVEMYTVGRRALQTRDSVMEGPRGAAGAGLRAETRHPADRGRGDRRRDLRPDPRPGQDAAGRRACRSWLRWLPT